MTTKHSDVNPEPPGDGLPGKPAPVSPTVAEPTQPAQPLPPKPDQTGPETVSPTSQATGADQARMAQSGAYLTTAQGARPYDTDHSLTAGARGPVLLQDHHLREKIMHFDHERIPERVVPARGAAVFPDTPEQTFEGIDLLDPTKIVPGAAHRPDDPERQHQELLRGDRAGRLPPRAPGSRHRRERRPAARGPVVLLPRHADQPAGRAELRAAPRQPAARSRQRHAP